MPAAWDLRAFVALAAVERRNSLIIEDFADCRRAKTAIGHHVDANNNRLLLRNLVIVVTGWLKPYRTTATTKNADASPDPCPLADVGVADEF